VNNYTYIVYDEYCEPYLCVLQVPFIFSNPFTASRAVVELIECVDESCTLIKVRGSTIFM